VVKEMKNRPDKVSGQDQIKMEAINWEDIIK